MQRQLLKTSLFALLLGSVLTGCNDAPAAPPAEEKIKLKFFMGTSLSDTDWNKLVAEPLSKKYPNITVEVIKNVALTEYVTGGGEIDLYNVWNGRIGQFVKMNLTEDMTKVIGQSKLNLGKFDPVLLDSIKSSSDQNQLFALPYFVQFNALYYNKDIFDKFGVPYPTDGMTWEETLAIAGKLSRQVDGMNYYGLHPEGITRLSYPLSVLAVDAKTNKASVDNEQWRKAFQLYKSIFTLPYNMPEKPEYMDSGAVDAFIKTKNIAMLASVNILDKLKDVQDLNWNVVQYPSYKELPNKYGMIDTHLIGIAKTSKHKEAAMKVIEVLTSDEIQMLSARYRPSASPLISPEIKANFAADIPAFRSIRLQSVFKSQPAPAPRFSDYNDDANKIIRKLAQDYALNKTDLNTALRQATEQINQKTAESQ